MLGAAWAPAGLVSEGCSVGRWRGVAAAEGAEGPGEAEVEEVVETVPRGEPSSFGTSRSTPGPACATDAEPAAGADVDVGAGESAGA
ncbi:hypothetical protein, partial [Actinomyces sp. oral taxon 849]|uniref:hypothetical protein n=1 Tax=Actinomyces sp. oral taxon 849 TaxID=653385 RepID=UPI001E4023B0